MSREIRARLRIERRDFKLEVDLTLPGRGVTGLFCHSGSGKTTCLRAIAGLERAADGYFAVGYCSRRRRLAGRGKRPVRAAAPARVGDGLSGSQPLSASFGALQHAVRRTAHAGQEAPLRPLRSRRTARHRTPARPLARPALRWRTPARGDRPRPARRAADPAARRAAGSARPQAQARNPALSGTAAPRTVAADHLCQPLARRSRATRKSRDSPTISCCSSRGRLLPAAR